MTREPSGCDSGWSFLVRVRYPSREYLSQLVKLTRPSCFPALSVQGSYQFICIPLQESGNPGHIIIIIIIIILRQQPIHQLPQPLVMQTPIMRPPQRPVIPFRNVPVPDLPEVGEEEPALGGC